MTRCVALTPGSGGSSMVLAAFPAAQISSVSNSQLVEKGHPRRSWPSVSTCVLGPKQNHPFIPNA